MTGYSGLGRASEATHPNQKKYLHVFYTPYVRYRGHHGVWRREQTIGRRAGLFVDLLFLVRIHRTLPTHLDSALEAGVLGSACQGCTVYGNGNENEWMACAGTCSAFASLPL